MNILYICNHANIVGGGEYSLFALIEGCKKNGHEVRAIVPGPEGFGHSRRRETRAQAVRAGPGRIHERQSRPRRRERRLLLPLRSCVGLLLRQRGGSLRTPGDFEGTASRGLAGADDLVANQGAVQ